MTTQKKQGKKGVSVVVGIFLIVVGIVFFLLSFSVLPGVGFFLAVPTLLLAFFFFIRAHRIGT